MASHNGELSSVKVMASPEKSRPESTRSSREELLSVFRCMVRARKIDEKAIILYKQNKCHFQIGCAGHEAVTVAAARVLRPGKDWAYPYYRDLAFCAAWGMTNREFLLNILNKPADPNSGGRQMPMHWGHKGMQIVTQSSPTGTQFLQAVGTAHAVKFRGGDEVVYCSAGEGTCAQGAYHEALNWAARLKLPIVFLIENNKYAISVHISEQLAGESVAKISQGYENLEVKKVNGLDYEASHAVLAAAVKRARDGLGPTIIDAEVVRLQSHSISDNQAKYRTAPEIEQDRKRDPIALMKKKIIAAKFATERELSGIETEIAAEVDADAVWAEAQPDITPESWADYLYADEYPSPIPEPAEPQGREEFLVDAINHTLDEELARDPEMVVYGQDVAYGKGGVFTVTSGLTEKYGVTRVFNSPLAEDSIIGTAIGMAVAGLKPVVEIQFGDYIWTATMQLRNEAAVLSYRSAGAYPCPIVVRVAVGGYIHGGIYHSQNIEATFAHFAGLIVIYPSNATDAKGLLKTAIRGSDPVLFLEHKGLYRQVYAKGKEGGRDDLIPIGKAKVIRPGSHATIVTWGALVNRSLAAAKAVEAEGYEIEVIDLRTIVPLDEETILESVRKTGRLLIAHEDCIFVGFGAEVAALVAETAFSSLDAPIRRVAGKNAPVGHSPVLEEAVLPNGRDVESALRALLQY
jgi:2-oxoisovalerate dehydrogenase E1 component